MSLRLRWGCAVVGLLLILLSCLALTYAFGSTEHITEQAPLAPTLFAPP